MPTRGAIRSSAETEAVGRKLGEVRKYLGFNQAEVARHLGITRYAFLEIEGGRRRPDALELARLAKLFEVDVAYFTEQAPDRATRVPDIMHLVRSVANVSERDREELRRFATYLQARSRRGA